MSYYTFYLTRALSAHVPVSAILMRKLIPRRFYPGRDRVGTPITTLKCADVVPTCDGVDWYGIPSIFRAIRFLFNQRPTHVIFQWWSGSVLPWYLILALCSRLIGAKTIIEFHESLDTGEAGIPFVRAGVGIGLRVLIGASDSYIVHSKYDQAEFSPLLKLPKSRTHIVPLGPFATLPSEMTQTLKRPESKKTILFFGTIRPYKGLEYLVEAFELLAQSEPDRWKLLVVGEPWEGWNKPLDLIECSKYRESIELVPRYVPDHEVESIFARADVVALPYLRSSASGPLHMTMAYGLPVVVTRVGGLSEVAEAYDGTVFVEAGDVDALCIAVRAAASLNGRYVDPHSWDSSAQSILQIIDNGIGHNNPEYLDQNQGTAQQ